MDPFLLQKQIRDNSGDLQEYCKDLKTWKEEMHEQDDFLKNAAQSAAKKVEKAKPKKVAKSKPVVNVKPNKVTDYTSWDKFDVEEECARLDETSDSELSDEVDEESLDMAMEEKEKGNKFVKEKKWDEAIACYSKAIDSYAYDPIFYANRALCLLKQENYKKAEADCTIALKLDNTYVKAYQRRAAARDNLGLLKEAQKDLLQVLELEPKNSEAQNALEKLKKHIDDVNKPKEELQRPVSKFTLSRQKKDQVPIKDYLPPSTKDDSQEVVAIQNYVQEHTEQPRLQTIVQAKLEPNKKTSIWPNNGNVEIIQPIFKPPNLRSKKPLKRIEIKDSEFIGANSKVQVEVTSSTVQPMPSMQVRNVRNINMDEFKVVERMETKVIAKSCVDIELSKKLQESDETPTQFAHPKTAVQFYNTWKAVMEKPERKFAYLKLVNPKEFCAIFKDSLDTKVFSQILETLANEFVRNHESVYEYLKALTEVRRFSTLAMFMSSDDTKNAQRLVDNLKECLDVTEEQVNEIRKNYGIKC